MNYIPKELEPLLVPIEELHPWEANPRKGDVEAIKNSIKKNKFRTILNYRTDRNGFKTVYTGNHRLKAAMELGMTHVPAVPADDLSHEQIQVLALADNRVTDLAAYDSKAMAELVKSLNQQDNQTLTDLKFTGDEIEQILSAPAQGEGNNLDDFDFLEGITDVDEGIKSIVLTYTDQDYKHIINTLKNVPGDTNSDKILYLIEKENNENNQPN